MVQTRRDVGVQCAKRRLRTFVSCTGQACLSGCPSKPVPGTVVRSTPYAVLVVQAGWTKWPAQRPKMAAHRIGFALAMGPTAGADPPFPSLFAEIRFR